MTAKAIPRAALIGLLLMGGGSGLLPGCGEKEKPGAGPAQRPIVTGVEIVTVSPVSRERFAEAVGTVRSRRVAAVAPQVMGRVTALYVSEGSRVEKGALLCTIEDTGVRGQTAAAEGMVAEAEAARDEAEQAIAQAEAAKGLAEKTYDRYRKLLEEKVVTRQEFDEVETRRTMAVKDHERAIERRAQVQARVAQAVGQRNAANAMLSHTRVAAPFAGVVTERRAEVGSMAMPGVPLLILEDTTRYRLEASVPEAHLSILSVGSRVEVALDTAPGDFRPAPISEIAPTVETASRTFLAKADLSGPGLRTGMYGRMRIPIGKGTVLAVPEKAISQVGGYDGLFVVAPDNVARLVVVTTGGRYGDRVEILSGIEPGARVAVSPLNKLADGVRVEAGR